MCDKGIFALNTGILDPGYKGAISSPLLNSGKMPYRICVNSVFLRLTFHEFLTGFFHQPLTISKDVYVENRKNLLVERFDSQFMAVSDIASIAAKKAFGSYKIFLTLGIPVAVGLIALFTYFSVYQANIDSVQTARENMILSNHSVDSLEDVILSIEQMSLQNGELQALRGEIARLNSEIASLKQRINSQ